MSRSSVQHSQESVSNNLIRAIDKIISRKIIKDKVFYTVKYKHYSVKQINRKKIHLKTLKQAINEYQIALKNQQLRINQKNKLRNLKLKMSKGFQHQQEQNRAKYVDKIIRRKKKANIEQPTNQIYLFNKRQFMRSSHLTTEETIQSQLGEKKHQILEIVELELDNQNEDRKYLVRWKSYNGIIPEDSYLSETEIKQLGLSEMVGSNKIKI